MTRSFPSAVAFASLFAILLPASLAAQVAVLDYDYAPEPYDPPPADFVMSDYLEDAMITTVQSGHYELLADATPGAPSGDRVFNLDDEQHGLSSIVISMQGGHPFDADGLYVVNPAEAAGEVTISAVGGTGGSVSAPTVSGPFTLGFSDITSLQITQNQGGAFAFDELTVDLLPEPSAATALPVLVGLLAALRRRRSC